MFRSAVPSPSDLERDYVLVSNQPEPVSFEELQADFVPKISQSKLLEIWPLWSGDR